MSVETRTEYTPGDPVLIKNIVAQLKSQGVFDQFRKECISDVDTKPAYKNLCHRVDGQISSYLDDIRWLPDLNKNQLRENIRKYVNECHFVEPGIARIVDQLVNPRINTVLVPKVEDMVYKYIGIRREESSLYETFRYETKNNNENRNKNDFLNDSFEISNSKSDISKITDNLRKNNTENSSSKNNLRQLIFMKNEENFMKRSPFNEEKINDDNPVSSTIKTEKFDVSEYVSEKNSALQTIDYFEEVKLEETRTYSNIESDEDNLDDDLSPPFELHGKSDVDTTASVESDYSAEVFELKYNVKEENDILSTRADNEEMIPNLLESTTGEESIDSTEVKKSQITSTSFDIPKTPTINYETSDDSEDNNYLKQNSDASSKDISGDRPSDSVETDVPDFSNVDKIAQRIVEDNREDRVCISNDEFPKAVDFTSVSASVSHQKVNDEEISNKSKEKDKDDKIDKRKKDTVKNILNKTNDSSSKDSRHRDKKHSDHKKEKEKHRSDKRESGRSNKDHKNNKEKDKSSYDSTKSKSSKEKCENRDKNRKSSDERDRSRTDQDNGSNKLSKKRDDPQMDRKSQRCPGDEKRLKGKEENKPRELSGKSNSGADKRSKEEKSKDKRSRSEEVKEEKKNNSEVENNKDGKETKTSISIQDDNSLERKNKGKKSENPNMKKSSKNQCSSEEKKPRSDRRSSDRDSSGPSSSSHYSHYRSSNKTEKERHSDKSKCTSSSSSTHKSKKNDDHVKSGNRAQEELKYRTTVQKNESKSNELLICGDHRNCLTKHSDNKDKFASENGRLHNLIKSTNNVDVDDTRLELILQSIHGDNGLPFKKDSKDRRLTEPGHFVKENEDKILPVQSNTNLLKRRFEEAESRIDSEELVDVLNTSLKSAECDHENLKFNGKVTSETNDKNNSLNKLTSSRPQIHKFIDLDIKKPKIARNESEFGKVVKLRKLYKEKMRMLQQQGKENANYSESKHPEPKAEEHEEKLIFGKHSPVNTSSFKDTIDYAVDSKSSKYSVNGKREKINNSVVRKIKQLKLNITRVDKCYRIVNGSCLVSDDEDKSISDDSYDVVGNKCEINNIKKDNVNNNNNNNNDNCDKLLYSNKTNNFDKHELRINEMNEIRHSTSKKKDTKGGDSCNCNPSTIVMQLSLEKKHSEKSVTIFKKSENSEDNIGNPNNEQTSKNNEVNPNIDTKFNVLDVLNCGIRYATAEKQKIKNEIVLNRDDTNTVNNTSDEMSGPKIKVLSNSSYAIHDEDSNEEFNYSYNMGDEETLREINIEDIIGCPTNITRITYESDFNEKLKTDKCDTSDELDAASEKLKNTQNTEKSNETEKSVTVYDENNKENVESKSIQCFNELLQTQKKKIFDDVYYLEPGNPNNDFKNFVENKLQESDDIFLQNFSINLRYPERYDVIFRNQLGAVVKRNNAKLFPCVEKLAEPLQNPVEYNSEIINHKSGDEKGIMLRIKVSHPETTFSSKEIGLKKKKIAVSHCNTESNQLKNKHSELNTNANTSVSPPICNNTNSQITNRYALPTTENNDLNLSSFVLSDSENSSPSDSKKLNHLVKQDVVAGTVKRRTLGIKRKISITPEIMNVERGSNNNAKTKNFDACEAINNLIVSSQVDNPVCSEFSGTMSVVNRLVSNVSFSESNSKRIKLSASNDTVSVISSLRLDNVVDKLVPSINDNDSRITNHNSSFPIGRCLTESENKGDTHKADSTASCELSASLPSKKVVKNQRRNSLNKVSRDVAQRDLVPKRTNNQTKCYYDSSDLYKPRPSFLLTSRRSRALNNENTK